MKCDNLKAFNGVESDLHEFCEPRLVYSKSEVDSAIDELKREHHRERHEYIDMVAQLNAEINRKEGVGKRWFEQCMEARAENVRLKRALYKACANWADVVAFEKTEGIGYNNSEAERWRKMESKCLKKAEEYK